MGGEDVLGVEHGPTVRIGRGSHTTQNGRSGRDVQKFGIVSRGRIGSDRLRGTFQRNVEQFVER